MRSEVDCDQFTVAPLEPLAQLAWRYGTKPVPTARIEAFRFFPDGSILGPGWVDSPQGFRRMLEVHGWMR